MKSFQKQRGFRHILYSRPILVLLAVFVIFFAWNVLGSVGKVKMTRDNRKVVEDKVLELEAKREKLSFDIDKLKTEEGVEESIREKFGLVKEGEGVIIVIEDQAKGDNVEQEEPNWFMGFLKKWFK